MTAPQWFSGPPPAVGWWPTAYDMYRWWDGSRWSIPLYQNYPADAAGVRAQIASLWSSSVEWRHWSIDIDGTDGRGAHE